MRLRSSARSAATTHVKELHESVISLITSVCGGLWLGLVWCSSVLVVEEVMEVVVVVVAVAAVVTVAAAAVAVAV